MFKLTAIFAVIQGKVTKTLPIIFSLAYTLKSFHFCLILKKKLWTIFFYSSAHGETYYKILFLSASYVKTNKPSHQTVVYHYPDSLILPSVNIGRPKFSRLA